MYEMCRIAGQSEHICKKGVTIAMKHNKVNRPRQVVNSMYNSYVGTVSLGFMLNVQGLARDCIAIAQGE